MPRTRRRRKPGRAGYHQDSIDIIWWSSRGGAQRADKGAGRATPGEAGPVQHTPCRQARRRTDPPVVASPPAERAGARTVDARTRVIALDPQIVTLSGAGARTEDVVPDGDQDRFPKSAGAPGSSDGACRLLPPPARRSLPNRRVGRSGRRRPSGQRLHDAGQRQFPAGSDSAPNATVSTGGALIGPRSAKRSEWARSGGRGVRPVAGHWGSAGGIVAGIEVGQGARSARGLRLMSRCRKPVDHGAGLRRGAGAWA